MKIEIRHRYSGSVLFSGEFGSMKLCVEAAVKANTDLIGAALSGVDLSRADLSGANLSRANLSGANLRWADLRWADLRGANLSRADLSRADLSRANLSGADLSGANLIGANLRGANLRGADLSVIRDDIWAILSASPREVPALLDAIRAGKINGSAYEGECACLIGTLEKAGAGTKSLTRNSSRPAEMFFLGINKGDTPSTSQFSALAEGWVAEWLDNMKAAFVEGKK